MSGKMPVSWRYRHFSAKLLKQQKCNNMQKSTEIDVYYT